MNTEERQLEAAEASVMLEKQGAIARIQGSLSGAGQDDCAECGQPIGEARRAALPSATRCIGCQTMNETPRSFTPNQHMRGSRGI